MTAAAVEPEETEDVVLSKVFGFACVSLQEVKNKTNIARKTAKSFFLRKTIPPNIEVSTSH